MNVRVASAMRTKPLMCCASGSSRAGELGLGAHITRRMNVDAYVGALERRLAESR
jgi:hypothetical protein